jgi:hypothetical protein
MSFICPTSFRPIRLTRNQRQERIELISDGVSRHEIDGRSTFVDDRSIDRGEK